jgi:hypothetical protein
LAGFEADRLRSSIAAVGFWPHPGVSPKAICFPACGQSVSQVRLFFLPKDSALPDSILPVCIRYSSRGKIFVPGFSARSSRQFVLQFLLDGAPFLDFDSHILVKLCARGLPVLFLSN